MAPNDDEQQKKVTYRITTPHVEITVEDIFRMPIGIMFITSDKETDKHILNILTYGGVLIEEFNSTTTPEMFMEMVRIQQEQANVQVQQNIIATYSEMLLTQSREKTANVDVV
jgi:hypothetical protein